MKTRAIKQAFALSALALAVSPAMAADIRFDGFASFVAGQVLDEQELAAEDFRGYDDRIDFQQNSLFALQMRADLKDRLSATAQIIAKGDENYSAKFNWAYLAYELTNELTVKGGRFRTPLFIYSDFLDVGYAYHWISPPESVYNLSGFDSTDGVMLEHITDFGGWSSMLAFIAGATRSDLELGTLDSTDALTLSWSLSYDWFTFHAVHSESEVTIDADQFALLAEGLGGMGVSQAAIDGLLMESDHAAFDGLGVAIDTGTFFAVTEFTRIATEDAFPADPAETWYASIGMRFGDWTTYATVENVSADAHTARRDALLAEFDQGVITRTGQRAGLDALITAYSGSGDPALLAQVPILQAQYDGIGMLLLNADNLRGGAAATFNQSKRDEDIYSIGVRYNFHPSACAKIEYLEMDDKVNNVKPSAIAVAVDLVY